MQNDKKIENNLEVCEKIFDQVDKPDNYLMCKALNVYDDRYRVNIYTRVMRGEDKDLEGISISQSYFCKYDGSNLTIVS